MDNGNREVYSIKVSEKLDETIKNAAMRAKHHRKLKRIKVITIKWVCAAIIILALFNISVNNIPAFAQIPLVSDAAKYFVFYYDAGVREAVENNYVKPSLLSTSDKGIKISINDIIADNKKVILVYSLEVESGYDNLNNLLPENFKVYDKNSRLMLATNNNKGEVIKYSNENTGGTLDYIYYLESSLPSVLGNNQDGKKVYSSDGEIPYKDYLGKNNWPEFTAEVYQYYSKNINFQKDKKAVGTIEITLSDTNLNMPDEINIQFSQLTEAYYQSNKEAEIQTDTKKFTQEAFRDKYNREAISISGSWNLKVKLDKSMINTKPQVYSNINFVDDGVNFNVEKLSILPTKSDMILDIGKSNNRNIELYTFDCYLEDNNGRKYNQLVHQTIDGVNNKLTTSFESSYFNNIKELYLVVKSFGYCYENDRTNPRNGKEMRIRIK